MLGFDAVGKLALGQLPTAATPVSITWFSPLTIPVRVKQSLIPGANQFIAFEPLPRVSFSWFNWLGEPVRIKPGLRAASQSYTVLLPFPVVSFSWFGALSEPKRDKPINPAAYRPNLWMQMAPSPFVATGWYNWFSEPVRIKPGLKYYLQRADTQDTKFIPEPATLIEGWFNWYSEPKRFPKGLGPSYQMAYTSHPRVLPNPNVTVTINAREINGDVPLIAVNVVRSNPPVSARVSIVEIGNGLSPTAVIES